MDELVLAMWRIRGEGRRVTYWGIEEVAGHDVGVVRRLIEGDATAAYLFRVCQQPELSLRNNGGRGRHLPPQAIDLARSPHSCQ